MTPFLSPEGLKAVQARAAELHQHLAIKRIKRATTKINAVLRRDIERIRLRMDAEQ